MILLFSLFLTKKLLITTQKKTRTPKIIIMSRDVLSPPSPFAPSAAITNIEVALAVLPPPSPASPVSDWSAGLSNLFRNSQEKCLSHLPLMGYSPAKKKGWCQMPLTGISPHDTSAFNNGDHSSDNDEDDDYHPTAIYNIV
jgi:hypothetical protein